MYAYENLQFGYYILFELNKNNAVARQKGIKNDDRNNNIRMAVMFLQYRGRCACYAQRSQNLQCRTTALFS